MPRLLSVSNPLTGANYSSLRVLRPTTDLWWRYLGQISSTLATKHASIAAEYLVGSWVRGLPGWIGQCIVRAAYYQASKIVALSILASSFCLLNFINNKQTLNHKQDLLSSGVFSLFCRWSLMSFGQTLSTTCCVLSDRKSTDLPLMP